MSWRRGYFRTSDPATEMSVRQPLPPVGQNDHKSETVIENALRRHPPDTPGDEYWCLP